MKRALAITGILLVVVAALPTIKNAVLYLDYQHGRETLTKTEGPPGRDRQSDGSRGQ
ncbi:hypothetical protein [Longibacter salinarum]|uniref:hypothetical protein n=1 Tax=Longibacter salinarum TaxID=1850348 RepID=UPI0015CF64F3|nr:hypothetical protein [Longibacter salinarum]